LVQNALDYVGTQEFVDSEDAQTHLWSLLDGAFGFEEWEVKMYRSDADYNLLYQTLKAEGELQRAVEYIFGHEMGRPVDVQGDAEETEFTCGCIIDRSGTPICQCWAGLWMSGEWKDCEFIDHVVEVVAEEKR